MKRTSSRSEIDHRDTKKSKNDEFVAQKKIMIRNDCDPHVYLDGNIDYVKVGNFVYKVKNEDTWKNIVNVDVQNTICLNLSQYNEIREYVFDKHIVVKAFYPDKVPNINKVVISLNNPNSYKITTNRNKLVNYILNILKGHIITIDQELLMDFQLINLELTVNDIDNGTVVGMVTDDTTIDFKNYENNKIVIYDQCIAISSDMVKICVTKCISIRPRSTQKFDKNSPGNFPLILDKKIMDGYIRKAIVDTFTDNDTIKFSTGVHEFHFSIKLEEFNKQTKYKNKYELADDKVLDITSITDNLIITNGTRDVTKLCLTCHPISSQKYEPNDYIININDITKYVKNNFKTLTSKQTMKYSDNSREILLKISYISPQSNKTLMYHIVPDTKITFDTNKKSKFIVVNNVIPQPINKIVFKIKKISIGGGILSFFFKNDDKSQVIESKKLEKMVKNLFPKETAIGHSMTLTYSGQEYTVIAKNIIFKDNSNEQTKSKYKILGQIVPETEFKFETSKNDKSMLINDTTELPEKPIEEMEKYVGGLSDQLKTIVRTIYLARGKLRDEFLSRGLKPIKGMIFYGPPGTGKTTIARNLGKIFGCVGDRFTLMSGPEVFNKWVGQSEQNVRNIFKPAKEAWKKYGNNSPLYMVVIDEIDAILPIRSGSSGNPVRDSVVNQFLAEIDGLVEFNNLICIGLTNRLELLDPAVIRPGRLEIHVKIDLPDKNGRMKIFDIHTQKLREANRLENINFEKLADLTHGCSGADIEGIIKIASTYSLERLSNLEKLDKEILDREGKIKEEDFMKALKDINKNEDKYPLSMYI